MEVALLYDRELVLSTWVVLLRLYLAFDKPFGQMHGHGPRLQVDM